MKWKLYNLWCSLVPVWDGSWWGDIGIAGYKYSNSTINTYLYNMQKEHDTCVCNIYVHIFPDRNHSANIPWSKIPPFPPPPHKINKMWIYIYVYLHTLNLITFQMGSHGRCLCGSLRCWTYSSHGVGRPPATGLIRGEYLATIFCLTGMFL